MAHQFCRSLQACTHLVGFHRTDLPYCIYYWPSDDCWGVLFQFHTSTAFDQTRDVSEVNVFTSLVAFELGSFYIARSSSQRQVLLSKHHLRKHPLFDHGFITSSLFFLWASALFVLLTLLLCHTFTVICSYHILELVWLNQHMAKYHQISEVLMP